MTRTTSASAIVCLLVLALWSVSLAQTQSDLSVSGLQFQRGTAMPAATTDRLYNVNGALYYSGGVLAPTNQQNLTFNPADLGPGTNTTWTFRTSTDNAVATLLVDSEGKNYGATPDGYAQVVVRSQDEVPLPGGTARSSSDVHGYFRIMSNLFNDNECRGTQCPNTLEVVSERSLRLTAQDGDLDFVMGSTPVTVLTKPPSSSEHVWQVKNTRIYGLDPWGQQAYDLSPWGLEIGGSAGKYFFPPRYPGDARDNLADRRWVRGSVRVGARLGVGCELTSSFGSESEHGAALCVQPGADGAEDYGAEIWSPQRAMASPAVGLRVDTTQTSNKSTNTGLLINTGNGTGSVGVRIQGTSSPGADHGLWIDWKDRNAEHLVMASAGGARRFEVLGNGSIVVGAAAGGGRGAGTINVSGDIYRNGSPMNRADYIFEHYYTGRIEKFRDREGAADYKGLRPLPEVEAQVRRTWNLPGVTDRPAGAFARGDVLLERLEEAYLYMFEQQKALAKMTSRMEALEKEVARLRQRNRR